MTINYNTAAGQVTIDNLEVTYNTTYTPDHQGHSKPEPIQFSVAIENLPATEAAALVTLRTYMEAECKTDCVDNHGLTFDN